MAGRFPGGVPDEHRARRPSTSSASSCRWASRRYFLVVADFMPVGRATTASGSARGVARPPGRWSPTRWASPTSTRSQHGLLFERFLNPERVSMPDIDIDFDERRRGDMIRYVTEKWGEDKVAQIVTYGTIKAKAAIKDSARVLGYPFAVGDRITKAMPPAVMGKDIPLAGIFDPSHPRYSEAGEIRGLYETDPDVAKVVDTAARPGGADPPGRRARGRRHPVRRAADRRPADLAARADGAIITQWDYPPARPSACSRWTSWACATSPSSTTRRQHQATTAASTSTWRTCRWTTSRPTSCWPAATRSACSSSTAGRCARCCARWRPDNFEDISAVLALYRPGPMGANAHNDYADRKNGRKPVVPIHPELDEPLAEILGDTYGLIVYQEQVMAIAQKLAGYTLGAADLLRRAMGKKKKEILDKEYVPFSDGHDGQRLLRRGDQDAVGHPGPVLRLRLQQGAHRRLRAGLVLDGLPQGQLPGRVHGRPAHRRRRRQGQVGGLPGRVPAHGHQGAAAGRQRVRRPVHPRSAPTSASASPRSATSAPTWSTSIVRDPQGEGRASPTSTTSCARSTPVACNKRRSSR